MQGSFQIAITSRVFSQTCLLTDQPMKQGTICAKVDLEGVQPIKGNDCGPIPYYNTPSVEKENENPVFESLTLLVLRPSNLK